ncbi:MAG TPA: hypothetical protein VJY62_01375, partial [Bacteroidia bacterium]|nr:hypothetical protein [Bacteroidia bacterium]
FTKFKNKKDVLFFLFYSRNSLNGFADLRCHSFLAVSSNLGLPPSITHNEEGTANMQCMFERSMCASEVKKRRV